jgi:hypothetical protein
MCVHTYGRDSPLRICIVSLGLAVSVFQKWRMDSQCNMYSLVYSVSLVCKLLYGRAISFCFP